MEKIIDIVMNFSLEAIIITVGLVVINLILFVIIQFQIKGAKKKYKLLEEGTFGENIEEQLKVLEEENLSLKGKVDNINLDLDQTKKVLKFAFKKMSIIRYNAFEDMGSDQSYSIALLDSNDNGFILSSIFSRESTSTYAKPIENGESKYYLTEEENMVLEDALNKKF